MEGKNELHGLKRRIHYECVGNRDHSRRFSAAVREIIALKTVAIQKTVSTDALGRADSGNSSKSKPSGRFDSICGALEIRDGRVEFECPSQELCAL